MTPFQLVLIGFGVALVLGVLLYNWWQERKYRQESLRLFHREIEPLDLAQPATAEPERVEPRIQLDAAQVHDYASPGNESWGQPEIGAGQAEAEPGPFVAPREPEPEALAAQPAPAPAFEAAQFEQESPLDPDTEYIARLRFSQPVMAPVVGLIEQVRQIGKPVRAMAQGPDGRWEPVAGPSRASYAALELGLQLADRSGAVTSAQIDAFCRALYNFAAEQGGAVSCPDKYAALELARALDLFCIEVDVLIGLNIVAPDGRPFLVSEVHRCATEAGLTLQPDGSYALKNAAGRTLYSLANQSDEPFQPERVGASTHGITLLFDVPNVADGLMVFDRMAELAQRLARSLGGRLVDDNGKLVSQESLQKIHQRLAEAYASMDARGIPAGGERASRLFV
ncbi:FtsZ-interacting cell division protein ZipA [Sulfuritortus calidifontis]|uniref:Cell division protein ZipA n=1 Tax=Sulfuritortus calidifontis TaxID=1914471 RepID=A0A4R3JQM0_9PROT|nr:cell division protein ZipA C-terminal FtsZ-binding domain-containing protein [Sulfuritortus calidifontis]TCS69220.1 FtsZ-interacting cell division protein ZipA [Sulfuritortus calidifontis]